MKKIIFLCFSVVFTNFMWSQTITVNQTPLVTEVGIPTNYVLTLNPGTSAGYTHYRIDHWLINANIGNGVIAGNINGQNTYSYFYNPPLVASSLSNNTTINIPITYGSNAPDTDNVEFQVSGFYGTMVDGAFFTGPAFFAKYTKQNGDSGYSVDVKIVCPPTISNPTILECCTNNVQLCATSYCDANSFTWTISGGAILSGQGTSCVNVTPDSSGNLTATCVVKRSTGLANYSATKTRSIIRTTRTASFTPNYTTTPPYNYICKDGGGLQLTMPPQCGISSITWVAPNCTIIGQNTLTPTIMPTSAIATGSSINIYAEVSFGSGCTTATTPSISFKILDSTTAATPQGYFTVTPSNGSSVCTAELFELSFVSTNGFNNGITTISPPFLWGPGDPIHYRNGRPTTVTVSNKNLCTGSSTTKIFSVYPPAPCAPSAKLASTEKVVTIIKVESTEILATSLIITPNPTNGIITAILPNTYSGNYQIFDANGLLVQESQFDNQTELQIELSQKLKSGIYVLKVITETTTFTGKIILNK